MKRRIAARRWLRALAVVSCCIAAEASVEVQRQGAQEPGTIEVNDPRPLAAAIAELERRHGWVITYEDPPYEYATEVRDVTGAVRKDSDRSKTVLIPNGGPFAFTYPAGMTQARAEPVAVLAALLEAYHSSGNPGTFRVVRDDVFHVLPASSLDARGVAVRRVSPLDTRVRVRVDGESANAFDMLRAILRATSEATGTNIIVGTVPQNLLIQTKVQQPPANTTARTALLRTFATTRRNLSWQLFCQPGTNTCALNVHIVDTLAG
jgi:hypothetical protein